MRLIDADEIRKKAVPHTRGEYGYNANIRKWAVLVGDIDDAPTIDAVPVVRCKDCKWCSQSGLCNLYISFTPSMKPDDFCSYGERRADDG